MHACTALRLLTTRARSVRWLTTQSEVLPDYIANADFIASHAAASSSSVEEVGDVSEDSVSASSARRPQSGMVVLPQELQLAVSRAIEGEYGGLSIWWKMG